MLVCGTWQQHGFCVLQVICVASSEEGFVVQRSRARVVCGYDPVLSLPREGFDSPFGSCIAFFSVSPKNKRRPEI